MPTILKDKANVSNNGVSLDQEVSNFGYDSSTSYDEDNLKIRELIRNILDKEPLLHKRIQ